MNFIYSASNDLGVGGHAYGKGKVVSGRTSRVRVQRVPSGRWSALPDLTATLDRIVAKGRLVTEAEALSGIGTYVGSCVCVPRIQSHAARAWGYGVVTGYEWSGDTGSLIVDFGDQTEMVKYDETVLQDLSIETYALRPCFQKPVVQVMPEQMKLTHQQVFEAFHGGVQAALRDSTTILQRVGVADQLDESQKVPLYELSTAEVVTLPIRHILDFAFYKDGRRTRPADVYVGETVFDLPGDVQNPGNATIGPQGLPVGGSLSDSDSDNDNDTALRSVEHSTVNSRKQKRSASVVENSQLDTSTAHHTLMEEFEAFLASKRQRHSDDRIAEVAEVGGADNKTQFRPTSLQRSIHRTLVNGKYSIHSPHHLLEILQIDLQCVPFLPHPAILRSLYSWEFGRGMSIMHYKRLTRLGLREAGRRYNLIDFSTKNRIPDPAVPISVDDIVGSLEILSRVVQLLFKSFAVEVVDLAIETVREVADDSSDITSSALGEIADWIDARFASVRSSLSRNDLAAVNVVMEEFQARSSARQRLANTLTDLRLAEHIDSIRQAPSRQLNLHTNEAAERTQRERKPIPRPVLDALPHLNGKELCMRFLSKQRCHSKTENCWHSDRGHFRPERLHHVVKRFISQNYGGLRSEFSDL